METNSHGASSLRILCGQIRFQMKQFVNSFSVARMPVHKRNVLKALRQALRTQLSEDECSSIVEFQVTRKTRDADRRSEPSDFKSQWLLSMEARGFPAFERVTECPDRTLPGRLKRVPRGSATRRLAETPQWLANAA
jgi:hypothetical protein